MADAPEIAGVHINDDDGAPVRTGFVSSDEFFDPVMERRNYLAHSKPRADAMGAVWTACLAITEGISRLYRAGKIIWRKPFVSGEGDMFHVISSLERYRFKYGLFRRSGDMCLHFFATATLSFADGVATRNGEEIAADLFGRPARNRLSVQCEEMLGVRRI